jgi:hypothetical protein
VFKAVQDVTGMSRALQAEKIREVGEALVSSGLVTLDEQAEALGLCRSTTWTILQANHKNSGLSANVINIMLDSPRLPPAVRAKILEYVEEKIAGRYGHGSLQLSRYAERLHASKHVTRSRQLAAQLRPKVPLSRGDIERRNSRSLPTWP